MRRHPFLKGCTTLSVRASLSNRLSRLARQVEPDKPADAAPAGEKKLPPWAIVLTVIGAIVLLIVGALILVAGRDMWQHPGPPQVSHPTKATYEVVKTPVKVVKRNGEVRRRLSASKRVRTVERMGQVSGRSDTVALAILATGAALLLAGGFAARLTRLKLPGVEVDAALSAFGSGVEVGSVAGAQVAKAAQDKKAPDVLEDKAKLAEAATITVASGFEGVRSAAITAARASAMGVEQIVTLEAIDDEKLQKAAEAAVQTVSDET